MITLDVKNDIAKGLAKAAFLDERQYPFVVSLAMNRTMKAIRVVERAEMGQAFDNPRPFTLNSQRIVPARKDNLVAQLTFKDGSAARGRSAAKYLDPEIKGGPRGFKGLERALQAAGLLPAGYYAVPAKGFPLDRYGNIPRTFLRNMSAYLKARQMKDGGTSKREFFVINEDNVRSLPFGVYQRQRGSFRMVIAFVSSQPHYRKLFDFYGIAQRNAQVMLGPALDLAIKQAIATSRDRLQRDAVREAKDLLASAASFVGL